MENRRQKPGPPPGRPGLFPLSMDLQPFCPAHRLPHDHAEHGVARDGENGPHHRRGKAGGEHIQHILHRGKAQGDKDPVHHAVKPVVKMGLIPGAPEKNPVLDPLLNESRHHKIGQKEVDDGTPGEKSMN